MKRSILSGLNDTVVHESAVAQVRGRADYIDDLPLIEGTLRAAPIVSPVARGRIRLLDLSAVRAAWGVKAVITATHIPGDPLLATYVHDEPILALEEVRHVGQVMALVVAESHALARRAARLARIEIEARPPLLHARDALKAGADAAEAVGMERRALTVSSREGELEEVEREESREHLSVRLVHDGKRTAPADGLAHGAGG